MRSASGFLLIRWSPYKWTNSKDTKWDRACHETWWFQPGHFLWHRQSRKIPKALWAVRPSLRNVKSVGVGKRTKYFRPAFYTNYLEPNCLHEASRENTVFLMGHLYELTETQMTNHFVQHNKRETDNFRRCAQRSTKEKLPNAIFTQRSLIFKQISSQGQRLVKSRSESKNSNCHISAIFHGFLILNRWI